MHRRGSRGAVCDELRLIAQAFQLAELQNSSDYREKRETGGAVLPIRFFSYPHATARLKPALGEPLDDATLPDERRVGGKADWRQSP